MSSAVECCSNAGVGADDLDGSSRISAGNKYLVARSSCREDAERMRERDLALSGKSRGGAYHVRFLNTAVNGSFGKFFREGFCSHRTHKVCVKKADPVVFFCQLYKRLAESISHCGLFRNYLFSDFESHIICPP